MSEPLPTAAPVRPLDARRIRELAAWLPAEPAGVGRPIGDRPAWDALVARAAFGPVVEEAMALLDAPLPEQPDDLYLVYSHTGNRTQWQEVAFARRRRLDTLVLAECLENRGRFLPAIAALIGALCAERTWVLPAHDRRLTNFHGTLRDVDLASSALAWALGTTDWLLGDRLPAATRQTLRGRVACFVFEPYRASLDGGALNGWLTGNTNWNAVCLTGCTGAALALLPDRTERARVVAAAETYIRNFLSGFTPDGYCSEGLGYWNYGFGNFVLLAETVRRATGGGVDLLARADVHAPARFGARIQIADGIAPAFADCGVDARPASELMGFLNRRCGLGPHDGATPDLAGLRRHLTAAMVHGFPDGATVPPPGAGDACQAGLRSWFADAGVLIGRPAPGTACLLGVALKGGHNAEHHNHNDLGSYVAVVGRRPVLLDPGNETYTARTFSARRYDSRLLNSSGHAVPVVGGTLQRTGPDARARVVRADFGDAADTVVLDLASAYDCPALRRLERTFVYSRTGSGSLTVTDRVAFASPQAFGTALITLGTWTREADGTLRVGNGGEAVRVAIRASGGEVAVSAETIVEDAPVKPTRVGIAFTRPVAEASIELTITPEMAGI